MALFSELQKYAERIQEVTISAEREITLEPLVTYLKQKLESRKPILLNFICTHNSRRSHLAQIWAQTWAYHFGFNQVVCYSGGTEATALYPKVAETLTKLGFEINALSVAKNPIYSIKFAENQHPIIGFSKLFDDVFNPKSDFCAIMTCDSASEACPFVPGAEARINLTFKDPKVFDNTPIQDDQYLESCKIIAAEMYYCFSRIKQ